MLFANVVFLTLSHMIVSEAWHKCLFPHGNMAGFSETRKGEQLLAKVFKVVVSALLSGCYVRISAPLSGGFLLDQKIYIYINFLMFWSWKSVSYALLLLPICILLYNNTVISRDATIPFFQNRSDPEKSEDRSIPIQSDTCAVLFKKKCM